MVIMANIELDKLPKDCDYCPLNYDDMYCTAVKLPKGSGIRYDEKRPDWCPLIDITNPEHMGRLMELFAKTVAKLKEVNHMIDLFITVDSDCKNYLHIETAHEDLRIPLTDISELMREKWAEANDELPEL